MYIYLSLPVFTYTCSYIYMSCVCVCIYMYIPQLKPKFTVISDGKPLESVPLGSGRSKECHCNLFIVQVFIPPCVHVIIHVILQFLLLKTGYLSHPTEVWIGHVTCFAWWEVGRNDRVPILSTDVSSTMCFYSPLLHFHHHHRKGCHSLLAGQGR